MCRIPKKRIADAFLRTKVSVAGKRNFEGRDNGTETASKRQGCRRRDKASQNNPANSGAIAESRETADDEPAYRPLAEIFLLRTAGPTLGPNRSAADFCLDAGDTVAISNQQSELPQINF
jgi:hypothetical protein